MLTKAVPIYKIMMGTLDMLKSSQLMVRSQDTREPGKGYNVDNQEEYLPGS